MQTAEIIEKTLIVVVPFNYVKGTITV